MLFPAVILALVHISFNGVKKGIFVFKVYVVDVILGDLCLRFKCFYYACTYGIQWKIEKVQIHVNFKVVRINGNPFHAVQAVGPFRS